MHPRQGRSWIAFAALFAPLLLLTVVTAMTWRAERKYARVSARVVHDYAAIAAWQYARRASTALHEEVMAAFRGIASGHERAEVRSSEVHPERILKARGSTTSTLLDSARFAFVLDPSGTFRSAGEAPGSLEPLVRARLRSLAEDGMARMEPHHLLFDSAGGRSLAIAVWMVRGDEGSVRVVYGLVSDAGALGPRFARLITAQPLLPATSGAPAPTESDFALRLTRGDGGVVFATAAGPGATAATDSSGLRVSQLRVTMDLTPTLASALLATAPTTQLPALLTMLLIAAAFAVLGVRHERRARELERLRTRFVANVSHELRTPLAQISMFAETLSLGRERSGEERRQFASIIVAESRRLTTLVESVLRFSRGARSVEVQHADLICLRHEVDAAAEAFAPIARASGVQVTVDGDGDASARVDRGALRQVLLNLLDNAVKHGGRDGVVHVSVSGGRAEATVAIEDSGPGVTDDWSERIFEPFVRADGSAAGAGIGLAVVRDLVLAHRGRVWVERGDLGGARFVVSLPAVRE